MKNYQPKIRNRKVVNKCSLCNKKTDLKDLLITAIDESNSAITQHACNHPVCRVCLRLKGIEC